MINTYKTQTFEKVTPYNNPFYRDGRWEGRSGIVDHHDIRLVDGRVVGTGGWANAKYFLIDSLSSRLYD